MRSALAVGVFTLAAATSAAAQSTSQPPAGPATPAASTSSTDTRPATTTFLGDTGLWNVPTAEVLPDRKWSLSAYRVNFDDNQGFSDVSNWPVTFGIGLRDRAEIFGSFVVVNRIDRDIRPIFLTAQPQAGGFVPQNPLNVKAWSGSNVGDFWLGAKFNLMSEHQQKAAAAALRILVKLPTGDTDSGASTGKTDFAFDGVVSKDVNQRVELSGYAGFIVRGEPDEVEQTNGFRWGVGAGFPSRKSLRFTAEVSGEAYTEHAEDEDAAARRGRSFAPAGFAYDVKSPIDVNLGLTWQHTNGFFVGGATWSPAVDSRDTFVVYANGAGDRWTSWGASAITRAFDLRAAACRHPTAASAAAGAEPSADGARPAIRARSTSGSLDGHRDRAGS